jgi:hypothetical protein
MVCYSSMSPLPSSTSMLCSASASFCFYALSFSSCALPLCSASLLPFMLCVASASYALFSDLHFRSLLPPSTLMHSIPKNTFHAKSSARSSWQLFVTTALCCISILYILFYVLHVFSPSSLPGLIATLVFTGGYSLNLFIISARYPEIPFLH